MKISKKEAITIAKDEGRQAGYEIEQFKVECRDRLDGWDIYFSRDLPGVLGDGSHFSVSVDKKSGKSQIFRGR